MALFRTLSREDLGQKEALGAARFLNDTLHYDDTVDLLVPLVERDNRNLPLAVSYLSALFHSRKAKTFRSEVGKCLARLSEEETLRLLRALPRNQLTDDELCRLVVRLLSTEPEGPKRTRDLLEAVEAGSVRIAAFVLDKIADSDSLEQSVLHCLLRARLVDIDLLSAGNPIGELNEFETRSKALARDLQDLAYHAAENSSNSFRDNMHRLEQIAHGRRSVWINSGECYFDAASFAEWLCKRIVMKEPAVVLRLGDGEGNFLPYPPEHRASQRSDQIQKQCKSWWGSCLLSEAAADQVSHDLQGIIDTADAIGVPPASRLLRNTDESQPASRGVRAVLELFAQPARTFASNAVLTSCHIHTDLDRWNLYSRVFEAAGGVSTVSCHDLAPALSEKFGVRVRHWYRMPPQRKFQTMYGAEKEDDSSYLSVFRSIMADIEPVHGELILVAAGFLGKFICASARERGAIALDIGSIADYWMGHKTRFYGQRRNKL
ncbi:MAG: hypothetical protein JOZ13_10005 [Alphaproteobacteria bacterium]|nr:hypothetical protein [Alphaproteobacteria bacterium]